MLAVAALGLGAGCGAPGLRSAPLSRMDPVVSSSDGVIQEPAAFGVDRLNGGLKAVAGAPVSGGNGTTWNGWKVPAGREMGVVEKVQAVVLNEPKAAATAELPVFPVFPVLPEEGMELSDPLLRACRETRIELPMVGKAVEGARLAVEGLPELPKARSEAPGELPRNLSADAEGVSQMEDPLMAACRAAKIPPPATIH